MLPTSPRSKNHCPGCFVHTDLCLCAYIPQLNLKTKLALVIHTKETTRTTNTGQLALRALPNSEMLIRGDVPTPLDLSPLLAAPYRTFLFYPCDEALDLDRSLVEASDVPIQLIVPDGNWRQASKVHYRHPELAHVPRVMIRTANNFKDHLRTESTEYGMATIHAIAEALGVIEGEHVRQALMQLYQVKVQRTLHTKRSKTK